MILKTCQAVSLLSFVGAAAASQQQRDESDVTIYAYGHGISGLPIGVGEKGSAVISDEQGSSGVVGITWDISSRGTETWNVTAISTPAPISTDATFYIIPTSDAFYAAGFIDEGTTPPSGAVTTGFVLWGDDVMYISGNKYLAQFWAVPMAADGMYELHWNSDGRNHDGAVPVSLKPTSPPKGGPRPKY